MKRTKKKKILCNVYYNQCGLWKNKRVQNLSIWIPLGDDFPDLKQHTQLNPVYIIHY